MHNGDQYYIVRLRWYPTRSEPKIYLTSHHHWEPYSATRTARFATFDEAVRAAENYDVIIEGRCELNKGAA